VKEAFVSKHFPRTRVPGKHLRDLLSEAQQYQYDVLRTVGGKLILSKGGWYREVPYTGIDQQPAVAADGTPITVRERIYGLNAIAMWKLVDHGLVECLGDAASGGLVFLLPALAKDIPGPRYERPRYVLKEKVMS
jgi:hypothetical protein